MLDVFVILALIGVAVQTAALWRMQWRWNGDTQTWVADAVDEAVKRQDDRIRKKIERSAPMDAGQLPDSAGTAMNGIKAGVPVRRE
jgi:hypothetical protein